MPFSTASLASMEREHKRFVARMAHTMEQALEAAGDHGVDHVRSYPQFKPRTGALQKATKRRVIKNGRVLVLSNPKPYAASIDGGARPHTIRPKSGRALRFRGRGGKWVLARSVKHPGNRPYKFLYRATVAAHRFGGRDLRQRLTRLAAQF